VHRVSVSRGEPTPKIESGLLKLGRGLPDSIQDEDEMSWMGDGFEHRNLFENLSSSLVTACPELFMPF